MWNVKPSLMCDRHLLGEHLEMHMFAGSIKKKKSIKGYVEKGLVETKNIAKRHDELAKEMLRRGFRHKTPLRNRLVIIEAGKVSPAESYKELLRRCADCRRLKKPAKKNVF